MDSLILGLNWNDYDADNDENKWLEVHKVHRLTKHLRIIAVRARVTTPTAHMGVNLWVVEDGQPMVVLGVDKASRFVPRNKRYPEISLRAVEYQQGENLFRPNNAFVSIRYPAHAMPKSLPTIYFRE